MAIPGDDPVGQLVVKQDDFFAGPRKRQVCDPKGRKESNSSTSFEILLKGPRAVTAGTVKP